MILAESSSLARSHEEQLVLAAHRAPDLTRPPEELTDCGVRRRMREQSERLGPRIETDDRVRAPVGEPHDVLIVDVDGVRHGVRARQLPLFPLLRARGIAPDLAG